MSSPRKAKHKEKRSAGSRKKNKQKQFIETVDYDENFALIIGYTSGGAPYGVTWDEMRKIENSVNGKEDSDLDELEELPFD